MNKIGIIGHFGYDKNLLNGQTIKTKILYYELCNYYSKDDIKCVDTHGKGIINRFKLLFNTIHLFWTTPKIIILLAKNGKKKFFPLLYYLNKLFKRQIYHDVIAGNLHTLLIKYPRWKKYLNSFEVNWVELESVSNFLRDEGINNVVYLPNFKRLDIVEIKEVPIIEQEPYRFCTFSRVSEKKGIEDAIQVISEINNMYGRKVVLLDIFGQVDQEYIERFKEICLKLPKEINYCGEIEYSKSVEVLKKYYMLLFPTKHDSEGFPGTIIDAYSAGLPVIASNNCELVINNKTGLVYSGINKETLKMNIIYAIKNTDRINQMRANCIKEAHEFNPDKLVRKIVEKIEE